MSLPPRPFSFRLLFVSHVRGFRVCRLSAVAVFHSIFNQNCPLREAAEVDSGMFGVDAAYTTLRVFENALGGRPCCIVRASINTRGAKVIAIADPTKTRSQLFPPCLRCPPAASQEMDDSTKSP